CAFVRQGAIALAGIGDPIVLRREMPRIERDEAPAPGATPSVPLVIARARVLSADGKTEQAVAALQSIVSADPRQAGTYSVVVQVQERGGLVDDAIASYGRVVAAAPALIMNQNVPMTRLALAKLLSSKGDTAAAILQIDILRKQWANADATFLPAQ